jgi:dienelactone hydrolase
VGDCGGRRPQHTTRAVAGLALVLAGALHAAPLRAADAPQPFAGLPVTFDSRDRALTAPVPGTLYAPEGSGPFPAVVLLHGCSGAGASTHGWAAWLAEQGCVALVVDSLAARNVTSVCTSIVDHPTTKDQTLDGYGALTYLGSLPTVAPGRIGVMGWSHGGSATLNAVDRGFVAAHPGGGFKAAVSFYPACRLFPADGITAPLLVLLGSADDWNRPGGCEAQAPRLQARGAPLEWHVYDGPTHAFDVPGRDRIVHVGNDAFHLRYNPAATADAHARVLAFFGDRLR